MVNVTSRFSRSKSLHRCAPPASGRGLTVAALLLGVGINGLLSAPPNGPLSVSLISAYGPSAKTRPDYKGQLVFGATSLEALEAKVMASGSIWACAWQAKPGHCWPDLKVPTHSLLVAAPLWPLSDCNLPNLVGGRLTGHVVSLTADHGPGGACDGPGGSLLALLAIKLDRLPKGNITVIIHYQNGPYRTNLPSDESTLATTPLFD